MTEEAPSHMDIETPIGTPDGTPAGRAHATAFAPLVLFMALSVGLLFLNLDAKGIWGDEITSLQVAAKDIQGIVKWTASDVHPPLYYILLGPWTKATGGGGGEEAAGRVMSIVFSALSVGMAGLVGRQVGGRGVGLLSSFLLSVSPLLVLRGSMIRWYSMTMFLSLVSIWAFLRVLEAARQKGHAWAWVLYVISSAALIYTHYLPIAVLVGQNLYMFTRLREHRAVLGKWMLSQLAVFVLYLPQLRLLFNQVVYAPEHGDPSPIAFGLKGLLMKVAYPLYSFCFGETVLPWDFVVTVPGSMVFAYLLFKGVKAIAGQREKLLFVASFFVFPFVFLILLTFVLFPSESFHMFPGLLLFTLPFFLLLLSMGVTSIEGKKLRTVAVLALIVISGYSLKNYYTGTGYINPTYAIPWKSIAEDLRENTGPDDLIIASSNMLFYYRDELPMVLMGEVPDVRVMKDRVLKGNFNTVWLEIRDTGDYEASQWKHELIKWFSEAHGPLKTTLKYVQEDRATVFFKEKLLKRPVPEHHVVVYGFKRAGGFNRGGQAR